MPLENQSGDSSLDWLSPLSSAVLDYDLNSLPHWTVLRGDSVRDVTQTQANRVVEGYFALEAGRLAVHATLRAPEQRTTLRVIVRSEPPNAGAQTLLDAVAKDLNAAARPFTSSDQRALENYAKALDSGDAAARMRFLQVATSQDPKLTPAGFLLAQMLMERGDRAQAEEVASRVAKNAPESADKARLEYLAATARGDSQAREIALQQLAKLAPSASTYALLGELHTNERKFQESIHDYEEVARLEPQNGGVYNLIGYDYAYMHNLAAAKENLERYGRMTSPNDPNVLDSLGEVHFLMGQFAAAEQYFMNAFQKSPSAQTAKELIKAAVAHLMTGDLPGADAVFGKYLDVVKAQEPDVLEIPRAQWDYFTGRRKQAMERLEKVYAEQKPETFALAGAQLSFWHLLMGDRSAAIYAANAQQKAAAPSVRTLAGVCAYLAAPGKSNPPDRWFQAVGLVLQHQTAQATTLLQQVYRDTPPANDSEVRALLAWLYVENKQEGAARALLESYPLIFPFPDAIFGSFTFSRFLRARAQVAPSPQIQKLAEQVAGDMPDRF
ncbi:MAG: hypothetical protein JO022_02305 [Acidobacteriaceae bacterium]|nr:hypothetical protein [Acidobacteriaceae bacterium]